MVHSINKKENSEIRERHPCLPLAREQLEQWQLGDVVPYCLSRDTSDKYSEGKTNLLETNIIICIIIRMELNIGNDLKFSHTSMNKLCFTY